MKLTAFRRLAFLSCLALAAMALCCVSALADPYPSNVQASPADATSILVTWTGNAQADSYRIRRMNSSYEPEVPADVFSYLDTGLTPGTPYAYYVASVVDGQAYWSAATSETALAMPIDTPAITSISSRIEADYVGHLLLCIDLTYTSAGGATGYEIFARAGDTGSFAQMSETVDVYVTVGFELPTEQTRYWFKVRAVNIYHWPEADEYEAFYGNFSGTASIVCYPLLLRFPFHVFLYEPVWPWNGPWAADYLKAILTTYGDPEKWPQDQAADTAALAALAGKLLSGGKLTETERQMSEAIHPHGLALLLGAYAAPPNETQGKALAKSLNSLSQLLGSGGPGALTGKELKAYYGELSAACSLVSLSGVTEPDAGAGTVRFKVTDPGSGKLLYSSLPGTGALLSGLAPAATPAPEATRVPYVSIRPVVIPTPTPTPIPIRRVKP